MSVSFLIMHLASGYFFHPDNGSGYPENSTRVVLHSDVHQRMQWRYIHVRDHWGYIVHVTSGMIIHPRNGGREAYGNGEELVLHSDRRWWALFAFDDVNQYFIHKSGKYVHPTVNATVILHEDVHSRMKFRLVYPSFPRNDVSIYGQPIMTGRWRILQMVLNPTMQHRVTLEVSVGKSQTEGRTDDIKYVWEISANDIRRMPVSQYDKHMMEQASSRTWFREATVTLEKFVKAGPSVITWQYVFDVEQNGSRSVFQSNLLADTGSESEVPRDLQYKV